MAGKLWPPTDSSDSDDSDNDPIPVIKSVIANKTSAALEAKPFKYAEMREAHCKIFAVDWGWKKLNPSPFTVDESDFVDQYERQMEEHNRVKTFISDKRELFKTWKDFVTLFNDMCDTQPTLMRAAALERAPLDESVNERMHELASAVVSLQRMVGELQNDVRLLTLKIGGGKVE